MCVWNYLPGFEGKIKGLVQRLLMQGKDIYCPLWYLVWARVTALCALSETGKKTMTFIQHALKAADCPR